MTVSSKNNGVNYFKEFPFFNESVEKPEIK